MRREAQLLYYEVPYFEISGEEGMAGDGQRPIADGTTKLNWGGATQTSVDCELNQRRRRTQLPSGATSNVGIHERE